MARQITLFSQTRGRTVLVPEGSAAAQRILDKGGFVVDPIGQTPRGLSEQQLIQRSLQRGDTQGAFDTELQRFLQSESGVAFRTGIRARERAENPEFFEGRFREAKRNAEAFKSLPGNVGNAPRQNFPIEQLIGEQLEVLRGGLPRTALFQELRSAGQQVLEPAQRRLLAGVPPQETTLSPDEALITQATLDDRLEKLAQKIADSIAASDAANVFPTLSEDEKQRFIAEATQAAQTEFAPQFQEASELNRIASLSQEQRAEFEVGGLGLKRQRLEEDVPRTIAQEKEEARITTQRLGRSMQEALAETTAAIAARGLTFSGRRPIAEEQAQRPFQEKIADVNRNLEQTVSGLERGQTRTIEDILRQQQDIARSAELSLGSEATRGFLPGQQLVGGIRGELPIRAGIQQRELETARERTAAELARQRELNELARNQELRQQLLAP